MTAATAPRPAAALRSCMDIYKPLLALLAIVVMIVAAFGVEIMSDGLVKLLPILAGSVR